MINISLQNIKSCWRFFKHLISTILGHEVLFVFSIHKKLRYKYVTFFHAFAKKYPLQLFDFFYFLFIFFGILFLKRFSFRILCISFVLIVFQITIRISCFAKTLILKKNNSNGFLMLPFQLLVSLNSFILTQGLNRCDFGQFENSFWFALWQIACFIGGVFEHFGHFAKVA